MAYVYTVQYSILIIVSYIQYILAQSTCLLVYERVHRYIFALKIKHIDDDGEEWEAERRRRNTCSQQAVGQRRKHVKIRKTEISFAEKFV